MTLPFGADRGGDNDPEVDLLEGSVWLPTGTTVNTGGGDVVIGGGFDPAVGFCQGDNAAESSENNARCRGVCINGILNAAGGNISIRGKGNLQVIGVRGVSIGGSVSTSGTGSINIAGKAKGASDGIAFGDAAISGSAGSLTSGTGTVILTGTKDTGPNGVNMAPYTGKTSNVKCGGNLVINSTGAIIALKGYFVVAGSSAFNAVNNIDLSNSNNDFTGNVSVANGTDVTIVDKNAIFLGAISISGLLNAQALSGNLTFNNNIATSSTSTSAIKLYADYNKIAGDATGGNIIANGTPAITTGINGRATLYTGSISGSTGLSAIVNSVRSNSDANTATFTPALGSGAYGIYRENAICWVGGTVGKLTDWRTSTNWNPQATPYSTYNAYINNTAYQPVLGNSVSDPSICNNLTIASGSSLTIPVGKALTVNGTLTNNAGITGLLIRSTSAGTGSLKIMGSTAASATVERYMTPTAWHIVSPPALETLSAFLGRNIAIPKLIGTEFDGTDLGMMDFNTLGNSWNSYYKVSNGNPLVAGKGYVVRTATSGLPSVETILDFKGTLTSGNPIVNISTSGNGWNCIGNPYTTAIKLTDGSEDPAGLDNFFDVNNGSIDNTSFGAYIYTGSGAANGYEVINYATIEANRYAALGQGFFVKAKIGGGTTISFTPAMQQHKDETTAAFKAAEKPISSIKLEVDNGIGNFSTQMMFIDGTTKGLDKGYDAGIFKADPSFAVYTKLVDPFDAEFQLQCLPPTGYDKLVIQIGIDSKAAGEIAFTVQTVQLAQDCKVILEDKLTNTFTDLSKKSYKAAVAANTAGTGRFYLHTGDIISGLEDQVLEGKLTAYANGNQEIRVIGEVGENAVATLFNGLGQVVLTKKLGAGNLNIIGIPNLSSGLYLLNINDNGTPQTIKVMVRK